MQGEGSIMNASASDTFLLDVIFPQHLKLLGTCSGNLNTCFQDMLFLLEEVFPPQHLYISEADRCLPRSVGCSLQEDEHQVVDIQVVGPDLPHRVGAPFHLHLLRQGG
jgi:hypothetical protein